MVNRAEHGWPRVHHVTLYPDIWTFASNCSTVYLAYNCLVYSCAPFSALAACSCPAMAQQESAAKKKPAVTAAAAALHSRFIVGSVSEENSEDENQGKGDMQLDEKDNRSLSPSSGSSDSTYEMGFDHIDGAMHNLRLEFLLAHLCMSTTVLCIVHLSCLDALIFFFFCSGLLLDQSFLFNSALAIK